MGNTGSANPTQQSNHSLIRFYSPSFLLEKNLVHFYDSVEIKDLINSIDSNKLIDIASIIVSRPDKLTEDEIVFLLEKILENYDNESADDFSNKQPIDKNDISIIDKFCKTYISISKLRKKEFFDKSLLNPIKPQYYDQQIDFLKTKNSLSFISNNIFNNYTINEITETSNILKSILPIQGTFAPNSNSFYPKGVDCHIFDFKDLSLSQKLIHNLGPYGLSSNGQFIFLLSSLNILFVFPILNNGALMQPKTVRLPLQEIDDDSIVLTTESCVTSFFEFIEIHPYPKCDKKIKININDFTQKSDFNEINLEIQESKSDGNFLCKITNGVIYVIVNAMKEPSESNTINFYCNVFDVKNGKLLNKVKLHKNRQQENNKCDINPQWNCDSLLPELFPDLDYCTIPIETNGTTISFVFEVQNDIAIYRTFSLITGEFLGDEKIYLNIDENQMEMTDDSLNHIIATCIDSLNNCRWILTSNSDNKVFLRKMQYRSSIDPNIFNIEDTFAPSDQRNEFLENLNNLLKEFCCSTNPPSFLICKNVDEFNSLLEILTNAINNNNNKLLIQSLCLLISLNITNNQELYSEKKLIFDILGSNIDIGLKFLLFIPSFSSLMKIDKKETVNILLALFSEASSKTNSNDLLIYYALRNIEKCMDFASFPLLQINDFQKYIQSDLFLSLFIIHQHSLIQSLENYLEGNNLFENQQSKQKTPLDFLKDYLDKIIPLFLDELNKCIIQNANNSSSNNINLNNPKIFDTQLLDDFAKKPIYHLFQNFLHLLAPLTRNHMVSQVATVYLTIMLKSNYLQIPVSNNSLKMDLLETCYLFGLIISTLVSGGGLNPFEEKFLWVIRSNLDLLKNNQLLENLNTEIKGIEFLESDNFALDFLYSRIFPHFNRELPPKTKKLDKCTLLAISQHMNCLNELIFICNINNPIKDDIQISPELRQSFIQMQRIRNKYKSSSSSDQIYNSFLIKSHMLLRFNSTTLQVFDVKSRSKILGDFILSSYSPEYIKGIFLMQKDRIPTTSLGFALLNDTINNDKSKLLDSIIGYAMNRFLINFDGLNSIILMKGDTYLTRDDINTFFDYIYPITQNQTEKTSITRIIPYRFFKYIKIYPDILESFLSNFLNSLHQHSDDPGFYSLVVLMIKLVGSLPTVPFQTNLSSLIESPMSTYKLSIIEHLLMKINDDFVFSDEFIKLFFEDSLLKSPIDIKIVMRIRYLLVNIITNDSLDDYLKQYLFFIGDHLYDGNKYYSFLVTELINLLRKIYLLALQKESHLRNNSIYLLLMNSISNENNYNERVALSLCAIFGFQMESINPYSVIKVCLNEDISYLYLLIQSNNNNSFDINSCICYSLPFNILNEPQNYKSVKNKAFVTVVPELTYTNAVFTDKLKSMLITSQQSTNRLKIFPACAQALVNFYSINPQIITLDDQRLLDFMCSKITHFNDVYQTYNRIKSLQSLLNGEKTNNGIQILPDCFPEFGVIQDTSSSTFISYTIKNNAPSFLVNIEIIDNNNIIATSKDDLFHFGIISDSLEEEELRISTVGFPTGISFPEMKKIYDFENIKNKPSVSNSDKNSFNFSFIVNMSSKKFSINSSEVEFPIGRQFCLIIFTKKKNNLIFKPTFAVKNQMEASELIFDFNEPPDLDKIIMTKRELIEKGFEDFNYLEFPDFVKNYKFKSNDNLKEDYHQYSKINKFSQEININKKLKLMPFIYPMNPVLHLNKSLGASKQIIEHHLKGLYLKLGRQWITILLMKIAINNPSLIWRYAFELFSVFSIPLETFNQEEFDQNRFPFSLEMPPWKSTTIASILEENKIPNFYFVSTNDMISALSSIIKNMNCMEQIAQGLLKMSSSSNLHQIALPQKYHSFMYFNNSDTKKILLNRQSIITFNNYDGMHKNAAFVKDGNHKVFYDFPLIFKKIDSALLMTQLNINSEQDCQVSILEVNTVNTSLKNNWVIDTPIELLIHLKNFALAAKSERHHALVKTILLDLYLGKSPFVIPYINQFQDFVQMKCSASLFYKDELYMKHLIALAGYLNSMENPDEQYVFLYENEQRLMSSKFTIYDAAHFPEFFSEKTKLPEPNSDSILIPYEPIDPGLIKEGFQSRILMIKLLFQKHESIIGYQFWEILPLWNRIVNTFGFDNAMNDTNSNEVGENDAVFNPTITILDNGNVKISNPTKRQFNVILKFRRRMSTTELRNSIFQYSLKQDFEEATFINYTDYDAPIKIGKGDTFFSIIFESAQNPWRNICYLTTEPIKKENNYNENAADHGDHPVRITEEYKNEFIRSMKTFLLNWTQENTETLLNMFNIDQLKSPSFESISQIVLESDLSKVFPKSVLLLRSLLIHQFSYIRYHHKEAVSEFLWNSCSNLVPILEKCTVLRRAIKSNDKKFMLIINRQASIKLVNDYKKNESIGSDKKNEELCFIQNRSDSIISQFSKNIKNQQMELLRGIMPFSTSFKNENGIDAGGLTKEFLNEISSSIFEASSQLFMKTNCDEEYYIPETRKRNALVKENEILEEYFSIGVIIGVICRSGYPQYFPFAPFIWKYISGEIITPEDIAEVDNDFKIKLRNIRNKQVKPDWKVTDWKNADEILLRYNVSEPQNDEDEDDMIEKYLNEYTRFKVDILKTMLNKIREGFISNTELHSNPMLSGKVLSFLVQGSGDITTSQLKEITKVNGYGANFRPTINIFWEIVDQFTVEQRRLLLKFITGVTRIPKINVNEAKAFIITIQVMQTESALLHPNDQLPGAQTCFNKLYLPLYTNKEAAKSKILYAIQNCLTMENQ